MQAKRWYFIIAVLIVSLGFLQYRLWFKAGGVQDMVELKTILIQQLSENEKLKKRNEELMLQIQRLRNSQDTMESRARNELGMVKKNEIFYQIVE